MFSLIRQNQKPFFRFKHTFGNEIFEKVEHFSPNFLGHLLTNDICYLYFGIFFPKKFFESDTF